MNYKLAVTGASRHWPTAVLCRTGEGGSGLRVLSLHMRQSFSGGPRWFLVCLEVEALLLTRGRRTFEVLEERGLARIGGSLGLRPGPSFRTAEVWPQPWSRDEGVSRTPVFCQDFVCRWASPGPTCMTSLAPWLTCSLSTGPSIGAALCLLAERRHSKGQSGHNSEPEVLRCFGTWQTRSSWVPVVCHLVLLPRLGGLSSTQGASAAWSYGSSPWAPTKTRRQTHSEVLQFETARCEAA